MIIRSVIRCTSSYIFISTGKQGVRINEKGCLTCLIHGKGARSQFGTG